MDDILILQHVLEMNRSNFHSYADYSVTSTYQPAKTVILRARHPSKPTTKSQLASFYGTANHEYLEKMLHLANAKYDRYQMERTIFMPVEDNKGRVKLISGTYDVLDTEARALIDLKTANTWKIIFDPEMEDWTKQQNIYRWLLTQVSPPEEINSIHVLAWYKDWKAGNALRDRTYPQNQVVMYDLDMWEFSKTEEFVKNQLTLLNDAAEMDDDDIPACTREERWERHPGGETVKYALMKNPKAGRAMKVESTMDAIIEVAKTKKVTSDSFIEVRYAEPKRCIDYCGINYACNWYQSYQARVNAGSASTEIVPLSEVM